MVGGQNDDEQNDGERRGGAECGDDGRTHPFWDGSVRMFDPEEYNATWTGVRPGVSYVEGTLEAERVGMVVNALYPYLKNHGPEDYMQPTTDLDGIPTIHLGLCAAGMAEAAQLIREALIARGVLVD